MNFLATWDTQLALLMMNALLAYSVYLVLSGGTFSLGYVAFIGLGMYTAALFATALSLGFWASLAAAAGIAAVAAYLLNKPLERLSGIYLAIATVSLVAVFRVVLINWRSLTKGALGIHGVPLVVDWPHLLLATAIVIAALLVVERSNVGRAIRMTRMDPMVASSMGVDVPRLQLGLFVFSSVLASVGGVMRAHYLGFAVPDEVGFGLLVRLLAMVLLGGVVHWSGPLVGAAFFTWLPELLKPLGAGREIANGLLLLVVIILLPNGIVGAIQDFRRRAGSARATLRPSTESVEAQGPVPGAGQPTPRRPSEAVADAAASRERPSLEDA